MELTKMFKGGKELHFWPEGQTQIASLETLAAAPSATFMVGLATRVRLRNKSVPRL